jgi:hypothetical protein
MYPEELEERAQERQDAAAPAASASRRGGVCFGFGSIGAGRPRSDKGADAAGEAAD